ncbi:Trafficking protein particle complex subunit 2 [Linum perenne]
MATTACFIIVSRNDIPIYEAEVGSATKREDAAQLNQFVLHAALDIVQDSAWSTSAMFLKHLDRFNDLVVSVYVTAGHTRLMLLHDSRNDDGIKSFFQEVHELYIKVTCCSSDALLFSCIDSSVGTCRKKQLHLFSQIHTEWNMFGPFSLSTI